MTWSLPASAAWQLDPGQSRVEATVIEVTPSGQVPHTHEVHQLQGELDTDGVLRIPLRLRQTDILDRVGQLPPLLSGLADSTLATVVAEFDPQWLDSLAVGESATRTLMLGIQSGDQTRREPLSVRLTRTSADTVHVRNAERVALDGNELMNDPTARTLLMLLGYEQIGNEVPVELDATLIDR
ncbi:MAG: hypothetical protein UMU75_11410 [Halomonas sp.]|nr:hypothetical protein [Halomonas sp.]